MGIVVPKREVWTPPRAEVQLHNEFVAELRDARTGKLKQRAVAHNAVLNNFRTRLAEDGGLSSEVIGRVWVGTGTSAPNGGQVGLDAPVAYAGHAADGSIPNVTTTSSDPTNGIWFRRQKYQFSETVANFALTEVGLSTNRNTPRGFSANSTNQTFDFNVIHTRALFKDANGNPIAINKSSTEILTVTATVYFQRGGVDSGMRLLDRFFANQIAFVNASRGYGSFHLGNGTGPLANGNVALSGSQLAAKGGHFRNEWFWDAANAAWYRRYQVTNQRNPLGMDYVQTQWCDWNLLEAVGTFSEVLVRQESGTGVSNDTNYSMIHVVFPCGTVAGTSYTKTDQVKLRQYFEVHW